MAEPTDIPAPLSDRTLVHGRNVMANASVILVLAWVPNIEITEFQPLGFVISKDGELSIWFILAVVLTYYAIRFFADFATDYRGWIDSYGGDAKRQEKAATQSRPFNRHARRLKMKCWVFDVAFPALMFLVAVFATYQQIAPLIWPPLP